ncbi:KGG domain-containing protein [Porcincola intestinalis]|uniref:Uncharacterized protein n=1 Tax=Porcincola intestinalis TaxID=2606632 RepID=A0A6L5X723_9FIRM|nr:KGG domain-containing protein [Porcincola intestinalis]MSS15225.1 hypothetical protein [Porcincola intestinalis]
MYGHENLIPMDRRSKDEAREIGRRGGKASGAARKKRADLKKEARALLDIPVSNPRSVNQAGEKYGKPLSAECMKSLSDVSGNNYSAGVGVLLALLQSAIHGDVRAAQFLFTIAGAFDKGQQSTEEQQPDDGFLDALNGTAESDWSDEAGIDDNEQSGGG